MSKLKTPREKKLASLALDGRNVYGENDKSSRKAIPQRKKLGHQALRRASKEPLKSVSLGLDEDELVKAEAMLLSKELGATRARFRKRPDESLALVIAKKRGEPVSFKRKRK